MRWLLDEMLPPLAAMHLRQRGHDALSVHEVELAGVNDIDVFVWALKERRIVVTENFADYAAIIDRRLSSDEPCVPVVFVRKSALPSGGGLAAHLAAHLDAWATAHPEPYPGAHWP